MAQIERSGLIRFGEEMNFERAIISRNFPEFPGISRNSPELPDENGS